MSKLLLKYLLVSPAVLGVILAGFAGSARAATEAKNLLANNQSATEATKAQAAENQVSKVPSLANVEAPAALVTETAPVLSENNAVVEAPAKLAANTAPVQATPEASTLVPAPAMPVAAPQVAQAAPSPATTNGLEQINRYSSEGSNNSQDQVTNVSQLRDVSPGDWAFEALRSLVERYGCIAGYPDGTYRGNRALSRFEFAAGLNACLNQVERLIQTSTADFVRKSDLETLQRLVSEFRTELTTLGARVDKLDGRVGFLEARQFSTTTKLQGEAIFAVTDEFNQNTSNNTVLQDRVRLRLNTSFTGKDLLVTRLSMGNATAFSKPSFNAGAGILPVTPEGTQTFEVGGTGNNSVVLDWLGYYFNFGSSKLYLAAAGAAHSDYVPTLNPYFDDGDGGNGALSTFATQNPIYRIGGGAGAAASFGVGPLTSILGPSTLTVGYLAGSGGTALGVGGGANPFGANNPREKAGLFDGDFAALGQLNISLGDRIGIGATYVHAYNNSGTDIFDQGGATGIVGTSLANRPSLLVARNGGTESPTVTNSFGGQAAFRFTDNISLSGFATYTQAILIGQGRGDIWTYGGGVAISDLGKKGNVLGLFAGVEPTLRGVTPGLRAGGGFDRDNAWHFEGFYKFKVSDNISVTPGVIWLTAPQQRSGNDDVVIGTLRTTFTF
jgi:Carbohydrate-selective porin, OprB family/S-layer homology domain